MKDLRYFLSSKNSREYQERKLSEIYTKLFWLMIQFQNKEKQVRNFLKSKHLPDTYESLNMAVEWLNIPVDEVSSSLLKDFQLVKKKVLKRCNLLFILFLLLIWGMFMGYLHFSKNIYSILLVITAYVFLVGYFLPLIYRKLEADIVSKETDIFIAKQKEKIKIRALKII